MLYHGVRLQDLDWFQSGGAVPNLLCKMTGQLYNMVLWHSNLYQLLPAKQGVEISFVNRDFLRVRHSAEKTPFEALSEVLLKEDENKRFQTEGKREACWVAHAPASFHPSRLVLIALNPPGCISGHA